MPRITRINSPRENADYTIADPIRHLFALSKIDLLRWMNEVLVKAKPEFHKKMFLNPSHQSPLFCALYHKVHLPKELNNYKFLRGQNHYDSYHLSGVSGHGVSSFYYPARAIHKCSSCHMPPVVSGDFGARNLNESVLTKARDHQFPGANTAIPYLTRMPNCVNQKQKRFLKRAARIGIFGLREAGAITSALLASLRSAA